MCEFIISKVQTSNGEVYEIVGEDGTIWATAYDEKFAKLILDSINGKRG